LREPAFSGPVLRERGPAISRRPWISKGIRPREPPRVFVLASGSR